MAGGGGVATVVIAQPDDASRELLARIVEAAGHIAIRLDASAPPEVVEATVEATANLLIVDLASVSRGEFTAVIDALAVRRFPALVLALADGPASGALAVAAGAARFLARPFHQRDLTTTLTALLDPDRTVRAEAAPVGPDAQASLLTAIEGLPPIDELADLPGQPGDHPGADQDAALDARVEASLVASAVDSIEGNSLGEDAAEDISPAQDDTGGTLLDPGGARGSGAEGGPDGPDHTDPPATTGGPAPTPSPAKTPMADHTFTDILKMGRQL